MTGTGAQPPSGAPGSPGSSGSGERKPSWRRAPSGTPPPAAPPRAPSASPAPSAPSGTHASGATNPPATKVPPKKEDRTLYQPPPATFGDDTLAPRPVVVGEGTLVLTAEKEVSGFPAIPGVTLTREIGRGGMGIVYEGSQGYLDRRVAVKVLAPTSQNEEFTRRFQREAKILAALSHPSIVACYQAGVADGGRCFLVMEYIDGPTLAQRIDDHGPLACAQAVALCRAIASALAFAHRAGVIHRDVKPANVLLKTVSDAGSDFPYQSMLADLGMARASKGLPTTANVTMGGLTVQGTVMGSPPTMAPEQFDDPESVDFRADIYGLGCVLFHCLTGKLAFPQTSLTSLIERKTRGEPPDPRELRKDVPESLAALVGSMLARKADDRPASYEELLRRLDEPLVVPRPSRVKWVAAGAAVLALGVGVWWTMHRRAPDEPHTAGVIDPTPPSPTKTPSTPSKSGGDAPPAPHEDPQLVKSTTNNGIETPVQGGGSAKSTQEEPANTSHTQAPDPPKVEPDATHGGAETASSGKSAPQRDAGTSEVTPAKSDALELPKLAPIRSGDAWKLFSDKGRTLPIEPWRTELATGASWSEGEDSDNSVAWLSFEGHSTAERAFPAPPWTLTGRMALLRPTNIATKRLSLVLELGDERGIELRQGIWKLQPPDPVDPVQFYGALVLRQGGSWPTSEVLGPLGIDRNSPEDYKSAGGTAFEISWDGDLLVVAWKLAEKDETVEHRVQYSREELVPLGGFPRSLALVLDEGAANLSQFVITGR